MQDTSAETVPQGAPKMTASAHDVPQTFTIPADLKHHMRILRKKFGASSKIGRRASNMEGAIDCLSNPDRDYGEHQRVNLGASIRRQLTDIARLADQPSKLPLQDR